jgi:undecaprenyl diphosphate synthase
LQVDFVIQSTCDFPVPLPADVVQPFHVAVIMDGNGRWATRRGLPRAAGHRAGALAVRRVAEAAPALGVTTLTLFALSGDNLLRPPSEVRTLFGLFAHYLHDEADRCAANGVRLSVIGRRDRLPAPLQGAIEHVERRTEAGQRMHLRIAIDYSARASIVDAALAAARAGASPLTPATLPAHLAAANNARRTGADQWPDVDLLVRSGGEQRLSDFLLWECAYAELFFTPRMWPDFTGDDLAAAIADFRQRQRRFGRLPDAVEPPRVTAAAGS